MLSVNKTKPDYSKDKKIKVLTMYYLRIWRDIQAKKHILYLEEIPNFLQNLTRNKL